MLFLITNVILVAISVCCYLVLEVKTLYDSVHAAFPHPDMAMFHINSLLPSCRRVDNNWRRQSCKFVEKYLYISFLQSILEVSHLSVEMHHRDLLLKHLTIQFHLLQQMDIQLPDGIQSLSKIYETFNVYVNFSVT